MRLFLDTFAFSVAQIIHRMDRPQIAIPFTAWGKSHEISWRRSDWRLLLQARKARFFLWVACFWSTWWQIPTWTARYESPFAHKTNASTIHECQQKCVRLSKLGWLSINVWCHLLGFDRIWSYYLFSMFFFHMQPGRVVRCTFFHWSRWTVRVSMEHIKLGWLCLINHNLPAFLENHTYFG